jgi:hypothetical protein
MTSFLSFIGGISITFLLACYRGLLLSTLWEWFVMHTFKGVPSINIPQAIGLSLLVACVTYQNTGVNDTRTWGDRLGYGFFAITVIFGIAWVITWFL